jgi:hypothetical protein
MSETFEKVLVKDDRLGCVTSKVKFQVTKGGQNITSQPFRAISATKSSHVYNVTVPSLETIISREVLWQSTVILKITTNGKPQSDFAVNYGVTDALSAFPLHSLVTTMTATINNNTISQNMQDTLPILLRMVDSEEFAKYDSMTPTGLDYLAHYQDGVQPMEYILGKTLGNKPALYFPNEADDLADEVNLNGAATRGFHSFSNNVLSYDQNRSAGTAYYHKPRGGWKLQRIYAVQAGVERPPQTDDEEVFVQFTVTEPLLMSPFVFGSGYGKQGFYGIQTMNFNMNIAPNANRAWRSAVFAGTKNVEVHDFKDSQLWFQFLTPHASDMLDPRNVVPFYELPVYRTSNFHELLPRPYWGKVNGSGTFEDATSHVLNSSNIQLSGIPDKLIICVRKRVTDLGPQDTDSYATIKKISLNFNNQAGLLSSMSQEQLYRNSVQSGLANMSWDEFCGSVVSTCKNKGLDTHCGQFGPYFGVGARTIPATGAGSPGFQLSPTTGSILVLNFAEVIQLTEEYYAPGSLGTFNLQMQVHVENNQYEAWTAGNYELIIIPMNSGVFVNERGTSSTFLSLLTKQDVLDALQQQPYSNYEIRRMVGGGFLDGLKSALGWVKGKLPMVRGVLENIPNPYAQAGATVLKTIGYGQSGGGHKGIDNRLA